MFIIKLLAWPDPKPHISARLARISEVEALKELVKKAFLSDNLQQFEKGLEDAERRSRAAQEV